MLQRQLLDIQVDLHPWKGLRKKNEIAAEILEQEAVAHPLADNDVDLQGPVDSSQKLAVLSFDKKKGGFAPKLTN